MARTTARKQRAKSAVRDRKGDIVIWQRPNIWLIAWAVFTILFYVGVAGDKSPVLFAFGAVSLTVWALLELLRGVDLWRRVLGGVVLLAVIGLSKHIIKVVFG